MRVVGKGGALGTGVDENCSSGMDGSETITRRYPGRDIYIYVLYALMPACSLRFIAWPNHFARLAMSASVS